MTASLLTWLWQGMALALSLSVLLHFLPRVNASTRCVIWWGAMAALVWLGWQAAPGGLSAASVPAGAHAFHDQPLAIRVQPLPAWALTLIVTTWLTVALFRLLRILPGVHLLHQLKDECRPFPRAVEEQLPLWHAATGRRGRLVLCDRLSGAAVLGLREPCIAMPSSLLEVLSAHDIDQVILHEYGHVRRRDDWMRLLQSMVEAALWIHPAAFLIGRELDLEREVACDDWVIARTSAPRDYAGCLSRVAGIRRRATPLLAPALFGGRRDFFHRVERLLDCRRNATCRPSMPAAFAGVCLVAACAVHLSTFPLVAELEMERLASTVVAPGFAASVLPRVTGATPRVDPVRLVRSGANPTGALVDTVVAENEPLEVVPAAIDTPSLAGTRSFDGVYQLPDERDANPGRQFSPWQIAGATGAGIGTAAKKAGTGMAGAFSRAGLSIGRSF